MLNVSNAFLDKMDGSRGFYYSVTCTLADSTVLTFDEDDLNSAGSSIIDSTTGEALPLGNVYSKILSLSILNEGDQYYGIDFLNAVLDVNLYFDISASVTETVNLGSYMVAEPYGYATTIELTAYDPIHLLDTKYTGSYYVGQDRINAVQLALACCNQCGLTLGKRTFRGYNEPIVEPDGDMTCRQLIGYIAMLAGGNACMRDGKLEIVEYQADWADSILSYDGGVFDSATPYATGDTLNGGTFWSEVATYDFRTFDFFASIHTLSDAVNANIYTDDVIITGITISPSEVSTDDSTTYIGSTGTDEYRLTLVNPLIGNISQTYADRKAQFIGQAIIGMRLRPFEMDLQAYPIAETMDLAFVVDVYGHPYPTVITDVEYSLNGYTTLKCSAESAMFGSATRASSSEGVRMYKAARQFTQQSVFTLSGSMERMIDLVSNSLGLYATQVEKAYGSYEYYFHNQASLELSRVQWKLTEAGFFLSTDYGQTWVSGFDSSGNARANVMSVVGLNADWINAGTISATRITTGTMSADRISGGIFKVGYGDPTVGKIELYNGFNLAAELYKGLARFYSGSFQACGTITGGYNSTSINSGGILFITSNASTPDYDNMLHRSQTDGVTRNFMGQISHTTLTAWGSGSVQGLGIAYNKDRFLFFGGVPDGSGGFDTRTIANGGRPFFLMQPSGQSAAVKRFDFGENIYYRPIMIQGDTAIYGKLAVDDEVVLHGTLTVHGLVTGKSRAVPTENYETRLAYAYETAAPYFGDIGTGVTDEYGVCYVDIDDIFREIVHAEIAYVVFLQKEGEGDIWVDEKTPGYFVVRGTPNIHFAWELKAKQAGLTNIRTEKFDDYDEPKDINYDEEGYEEYLKYVSSKEDNE